MKFTIITHAVHKIKEKDVFAYEPYVREMNLWLKYVDEVKIVAPVSNEEIAAIESKYQFQHNETKRHSESACPAGRQGEAILSNEQITTSHTPRNDESERHSESACPAGRQGEAILSNEQIATSHTPRNDEIKLIEIPSFDITLFKNGLNAIFKIPKILLNIYKAMKWADHIHLRCPGNIGLLGSIVQIAFPSKPKTIKYAGNWDPKSKQPLSYRFQKWLVSNTFLTKNAKVLVYGEWANQSKNIVPFFTASYSEKELLEEQIATSQIYSNKDTKRHSAPDAESHKYHFLFVGGLTPGKQPLLSVQVIHQLKEKGYTVQLDVYGEGTEQSKLENYIRTHSLKKEVILHGNTSKEIVKEAYKKAHFLVFISKSEGWPKVVAEAMFWGCLPISSNVSCIPFMLGNGSRGAIANPNINEIVSVVESYICDNEKYQIQVKEAMEWSRQYTLEKFEKEIGKLLK
ncbi:glycosyltransferase [Lutibacter sp.]|uniref:glycosyltransferase n=1 Tax=Lutibacter sp. TaxID=1925666 RepID=UPI0025BACD7D|nr:glycosyltransferase [Lutibacter sp.]MCF6182661.1 glycosyltransferase [Lutibacter sp.]